MSKFLLMGMLLNDVIKASTYEPLEVIKHAERGNPFVGGTADAVMLNLHQGNLVFMIRQVIN